MSMRPPARYCAAIRTTERPLLVNRLRLAPALVLCISLCAASNAGSANDINQDEVLKLRRAGEVMPLQDILAGVAQRYPAMRVLEVELESKHGNYRYEIDILTADDVARELEIDAHTGAILEDEADD